MAYCPLNSIAQCGGRDGRAALTSTGGSCPFAQQHVSIPSVQLNTDDAEARLCTYLANGTPPAGAARCHQEWVPLIDTASGYANERVVAAAMADGGLRRDEFFVTTKLWCDYGTARTQRAIANSLRRLETEYDPYLIHAGQPGRECRRDSASAGELQPWKRRPRASCAPSVSRFRAPAHRGLPPRQTGAPQGQSYLQEPD